MGCAVNTDDAVTLVCTCGTRVGIWHAGRLELRPGRNPWKKRRGGRPALSGKRIDLAHNYGQQAVALAPSADGRSWCVTFGDGRAAELDAADAQGLAVAAGLCCFRCWVWFDVRDTFLAGTVTARHGRTSLTLRNGGPWVNAVHK